MLFKRTIPWFLIFVPVVGAVFGQQRVEEADSFQLIDDFQQDSDGSLPSRWRMRHEETLVPLTQSSMRASEYFQVVREGSNLFVRGYSHDEATSIYMGNSREGFDWDLEAHPILEWDWRAHKLPVNAREDMDKLNDSGGGLYVIFDIEGFLFRRPRTIKYVYSSTLPVGTTASYGKLVVIVASSGVEGIGSWEQVRRNVIEDYQNVFGGTPERRPMSIRLWSDSDNTGTEGEVDFDNLKLVRGN